MTKKKHGPTVLKSFDDLDAAGIGAGYQPSFVQQDQPIPDEAPRDRSLLRTAGDYGISALKGAIGVPEAAVGLADIATGGRAGQALESIGFRPKDAKAYLNDQYSDQQKQAFQNVGQAEGFGGKFVAALQNPSVITHGVVESLPSMGAGAVVGRGIMAAAPRVSGALAAGVGEGVIGGGSAAEQIRQETPDGLLTPAQSGLAVASGLGTTAFGVLGNKVAKSLGIHDVDTMLVSAATNPAAAKGVVRRVLEGAASEGLLEELPQSIQEQVLQNVALGKDLTDGVDQAAVLSMLSGAAMGGGANILGGGHQTTPATAADPVPTAAAAPLALPAPVITVGPDGTAQTVADRQAARDAGPLARAASLAANVTDVVAKPGALARAASTQVEPAPVAINLGVSDEGQNDQAPSDVGDVGIPGAGGAELSPAGELATTAGGAGPVAGGLPGSEAPITADDVAQHVAAKSQPAAKGAPEVAAAPQTFATYDEADAYRREQKQRGSSVQALPVPTDGGFTLAVKGSPEYPAAEKLREERRAAKERADAGILDGDILNKLGKPFTIRLPATNAVKANPGFEVVAVQGGFVARKAATTPQAKETPADVPQPAKTPEETSPAPGAQVASEKPAAVAAAIAGAQINKEWTAFSPESGTKSIPRADMPQIKAEHRGAMVNFLNARGISHEQVEIPAGDLKPTQAEFSPAKVELAKAFEGGDRSILVSADGHVLDGHHQWLAKMDAGEPVKAIRLHAPIGKLLEQVKEFPSVQASTGATETPAHLGRNNTPLSEGGKPFKIRMQADMAKKLQPQMRVVKVAGGFALADKTPAQLEAQAKAARRMAQPNTSPAGQPIPAHAFIAAEGGLHQDTRSDLGVQGNPRIGNRTLYAGQGKGLSLEQATEKLVQSGYLREGASHSDTLALVKRSLTNPQYTAEGTERMAEADKQAKYEAQQAEQEAVADVESVEDAPFEYVADLDPNDDNVPFELTATSKNSLEADMRSMGFTQEEINEALANESGAPQADRQDGGVAVEADARGTQAGTGQRNEAPGADKTGRGQDEGLTAPTRADILAQQDQADAGEKAAKAQRRADDERARKEQERKDITARSQAAADTFELGGDAEQNLTGQGDIFSQADEQANPPAKPDALSEREKAAKAKMLGAAAKLAELLSKNTRMNITPEQEQKMLPIVIELFDGALELGYVKFKQAARYVREFLANAIDQDAADSIPIDTLQGAYIATARRHSDKAITSKKDVISVETIADLADTAEEAASQAKEENDVPSPDRRVERDSAQPAAQSAMGDTVSPDAARAGEATAEAGGRAGREAGGRQQDGTSVPFGSAPVAGERSNQRLPDGIGQPEFESIVTGTDFREPGGDSGITGVPAEPIPASEVVAVADQGVTGLKAAIESNRAAKAPAQAGNLANIAASLPQLLSGQHADVQMAEQRFAKPDGYGMLFTNGTGTGKTFSGLGIVKRFAMQGKSSTLIVVPDNKIASDWIASGKLLGLNIGELADTKDAGKGIVVTTYANLGENDQLAKRAWDLVVADEAHTLMQSADGAATGYLDNLRAITMHPDGVNQRHSMLHRELLDQISALREESKALGSLTGNSPQEGQTQAKDIQRRMDVLMVKMRETQDAIKADVAARQGAARPRLVALSATPFAYEKTIDWANGYLFDYNDGQPSEEGVSRGYNAGDNRERYFMQHFGYSMRYNKLTQPDAKVDRGLMQRQWNGQLKKAGALSGRMLDVKPDYDRRFILVNSAIGNRIDEALQWVSDQRQAEGKGENGYSLLGEAINEKFKYLEKRYLLEAIKATEVIPIVKQHMAMGRKVVVFHDYKKGGGFNPFQVTGSDPKLRAAVAAFNTEFADLVRMPLGSMPSPIDVFKREIPDVLLVNGDEKQKDLLTRYKSFQDDGTGPQVMLVQSAKNKGWSGHDTTGKHQRVLINLGQPTAPTLAIQQEGRIYRTGQASDAIMRYMNTGTNWERWTFATTIASRASTAENLGMGEMARALKDSFIQSFEESDAYAPGHEDEGKGGKARDQAANNAITEYDRAKTMYWATQKKNSRTKAQEGADYFATPEPLGLKMVQWLDARSGEDTLEPSGGHGAIARWLPDTTKRTVVEPSLALRSRLAMVMNPTEDRIIAGTFEELGVVNKYDGIVMNPPFGTAGRTAVDHIAKAATHLRDGGRIVALLPTGPAADKKFEQWFYEKSNRPVKPVFTHPTLGAIYKGDKITTRAPGSPEGVVEGFKPENMAARQPANVMLKVPGRPGTTGIWVDLLMAKESTGKRTEEYSPAADLHLVANITLPQVAFERAGTAVATRIVVIEKQSDKAASPIMQRNRDLSDITDINELFNSLEDMTLPARAKAVEAAPTETPKAEKPAKATAAPKAATGDLISLGGRETYEVTTYTTNGGKELRGVWVPTKAMALQHGPSTFEKKGLGFFVRERDFPKVDAPAFSRGYAVNGLPVAEVQREVDDLTRKWANAPKVVVASNIDDPRVPEAVRAERDKRQSLGAAGAPRGVFLNGTVYLLADQLPTPAHAAITLFHESLGHAGLRGTFGDALNPILQQIADLRRADVAEKAQEYNLDLSKPQDRLIAAEEVLAEWAQRRPELGYVRRAIAAVRNWFRTYVPGFKKTRMTDNDIIAYLVAARGWVERGGVNRSSIDKSQEPMFSRADAGGVAARMGESLKAATATNIKARAGFKLTDYLGLALQFLGRRQLVDIYGGTLPMEQYSRLAQQMEADKNEVGAEADGLATAWGKLPDERQLAELMHDATLAQMDPAKPLVAGENAIQHAALRKRFTDLTPEAQKVYLGARDAYQAHHKGVLNAIKERIERSELKGPRKVALLAQMDSEFYKSVKGVYFPLSRFGQYVVVTKGPDGKVLNVSRAETMAEGQTVRKQMLQAFPESKGYKVGKVILSKEFVAGRDAVGRGFMTELYGVLDKQDMDASARAELEDTLGQLYLSSLPDLSWAKHGIHRKGTPGFSQDARRAFAQNMFHGARYLAKLRYSDLMQDELTAMQKRVDDWVEVPDEDFNSARAQRVVDEMNKRHDALMNPQSNPLSTALTSFGFIFHLGLSPASALVNLTQTALVAYPVMGAKWGFDKSAAALMKASQQAVQGKNDITGSLNADERRAYDEAVRNGTIDVTMAHDLAGISQGEDAGVMWKIRPVMKWASFLFHHAERFNRQVTFVAAYRLAQESGADHATSFEQATKATYDGHFDYSSANRPRVMQGNAARVLLLFKQYGQNMVYTLGRSAQQALAGATPQQRAEARRALGGLLAMHGMAAGALGLPMVTTLLAVASMLGGDDDEPWDAQVAMQNMLADAFGQKPAEVLTHGLSRLTPWDISGRVGLDKLILPDIQEGLEGQRLGESVMAAALGPVAGIGINVLKGLQDMGSGHYLRGMESMMPAVLRGPLKALRYANEGAQDKTGVAILDEVSPAAVAGQAFGFSPSEVRMATEGKSAIIGADRALNERRSHLVAQFAMASMAWDVEGQQEARAAVAKFNEKNPGRRIFPMHLMQSVRARQRRIDQAKDGVYLSKNRQDAREAGRFAKAD